MRFSLAPTKRKIRAPQRKKAASRNPIKTLRTRDDVSQQTYSEEKREMSAREALRFTNDPCAFVHLLYMHSTSNVQNT